MEYTNKLVDLTKKQGGIDKETMERLLRSYLRLHRMLQKNFGKY